LNVISILSEFPLILFDKMDIGKTNAARPNNMSNKMIPKILMDVLKLKKPYIITLSYMLFCVNL
jgi:hypothetical protein